MDPRSKCEHVTNNTTESVNNMLKEARGGTFMGLLEEIMRLMTQKIVQRSEECEMWETEVATIMNKRIIKSTSDGRDFRIMPIGDGEYEVYTSKDFKTYIVKLKE